MSKRTVATTTIRLTADDLEVLGKLKKYTGLGTMPMIRASLRASLRRIEKDIGGR